MPELPEVETIRQDLEKEIKGFVILDLQTDTPKMVRPSPEAVKKAVLGSRIVEVERRAKLLILEVTSNGDQVTRNSSPITHYLLIHLRLAGRLLVRKPSEPEDRWQHVVLKLKKGEEEKELRFCDVRKFGYMKLVGEEEFEKVYQKYGPEPLDDLTFEKFEQILSSTRKMIKTLLTDQERIGGVGNIYANEALWRAKIHPQTPANSLSASQRDGLFKALEEVLQEALEHRGTTPPRDYYLDAYGNPGSYQEKLQVYGKEGEPCPRCGTPIKRIEVGGRGTFFCPRCQEK